MTDIGNAPALPTYWARPSAQPYECAPVTVKGPPRERIIMRDPPTLPAMPQLLAEEPGEQAVTVAALKAMMATDYQNTDQVRAMGAAVRLATFAVLAIALATLGFWAARIFWMVGWEWLPVGWLGALAAALVYLIVTEVLGRRYSAAGIEHAKIRAAVAIHRDRLESREAMHQAATEAWESVLTKYLEKWGKE